MTGQYIFRVVCILFCFSCERMHRTLLFLTMCMIMHLSKITKTKKLIRKFKCTNTTRVCHISHSDFLSLSRTHYSGYCVRPVVLYVLLCREILFVVVVIIIVDTRLGKLWSSLSSMLRCKVPFLSSVKLR